MGRLDTRSIDLSITGPALLVFETLIGLDWIGHWIGLGLGWGYTEEREGAVYFVFVSLVLFLVLVLFHSVLFWYL